MTDAEITATPVMDDVIDVSAIMPVVRRSKSSGPLCVNELTSHHVLMDRRRSKREQKKAIANDARIFAPYIDGGCTAEELQLLEQQMAERDAEDTSQSIFGTVTSGVALFTDPNWFVMSSLLHYARFTFTPASRWSCVCLAAQLAVMRKGPCSFARGVVTAAIHIALTGTSCSPTASGSTDGG